MKFKNIKKNQPKKVYAPRKPKVAHQVTVQEKRVEDREGQIIGKKESKGEFTLKKEKTLKKLQFPRNYRFITERRFWMIALSIVAFFSLIFVSADIYVRIQRLNDTKAQRADLLQKEKAWVKTTQEKPEYRDGYIEVASYAYQLGDKNTALLNINKALSLDPNFIPALQEKGLIETMGR